MADNAKKTKPLAQYHMFSVDEKDVLTPVGTGLYPAKTAEGAVTAFLLSPGSDKVLARSVKEGTAAVVVVPDRNYTKVTAEVETRTKVKLKAA